jgi:hypothetical protein
VRAAVPAEIAVIPDSTITCPACGAAKTETMPTDSCQYFYECAGCGELLRPKPGDCCVFCSYGSVPCPPIQAGETPTCRPSEQEELHDRGDRTRHSPPGKKCEPHCRG